MKHGDHSSVFIRQFHHGLVQPFLELGKVDFPHRAAGGGQFQEFLVVLYAAIDVVQAKMITAAAFLEEVQRHVDRDGVDPSVKGRLTAKTADRFVSFGKNVLQKVVRILMV